jgi:hypothetical protein
MSREKQALIDELLLAATKIADITRDADPTMKIPNSEWTVVDAVAHVIVTQRIVTSILSGKKSPYIKNTNDFIEEVSQKLSREFIAKINKKFLSQYSQRNSSTLAKSLVDEINTFIIESEKYSDDYIFRTHYGKMNLLELHSYSLMHVMIHGCAVAKALNRQLPVTEKGAVLTVPFTKIIMLKLFDKKAAGDFTANFVVNMRGVEKFAIICDKGKIKIESTIPQQVDCYILADPLAFFLVSTGIISKWMPILKGKLFLYGKKPWLAFRLQTLFQSL